MKISLLSIVGLIILFIAYFVIFAFLLTKAQINSPEKLIEAMRNFPQLYFWIFMFLAYLLWAGVLKLAVNYGIYKTNILKSDIKPVSILFITILISLNLLLKVVLPNTGSIISYSFENIFWSIFPFLFSFFVVYYFLRQIVYTSNS